MATFADFKRVLNCLWKIAEQCAHFIRGFEIQLRDIAHAGFILHHLASADAKHHIVRLMIAASKEVNVIRGNEFNSDVPRNFRQMTIALALLFHPVTGARLG